MNQEKSCGAVIYYKDTKQVSYLVIQSRLSTRHWGFVKGHTEPGESERQTASREIQEEVGLVDLTWEDNFRFVHEYKINPTTIKEVVFFIARTTNQHLTLCQKEVLDSKWLSYEEALKKLTFKADKELLTEVHQKLISKPV